MSADHSEAEIVTRNDLVAALKAHAPETVIDGLSSVVAKWVISTSGKHYVFGKVDPIFLSLFSAHCITRLFESIKRLQGIRVDRYV